MATFTVEHGTSLSPAEAFEKVRRYLQESEGLKKLDGALQYKFDESAKTGHVKGSKFECNLKIADEAPTKVVLQINISMFLAPFKGTIEKTLREKMTKILG